MLPPLPGEVREGFLEGELSLEGWEVVASVRGLWVGDGERGDAKSFWCCQEGLKLSWAHRESLRMAARGVVA